jgi:transposase
MYRRKQPQQETCFIPGSLSDYLPEEHILKRVKAILDLRWLEEEVRGLYAEANGRPCIEPERALRLMLAGFFHGVVQDRKLMREARVNIAYLWFAGYELGEALPDHSSLTRIRQRWGEERFRKIFERSVAQCVQAGLVGGEMLHVDASLVRADVSWSSLVQVHVTKVLTENEVVEEATAAEALSSPPRGRRAKRQARRLKKISVTDPDASLSTSSHQQRMEPSYKQHTAVDDKAGIIVDVQVTTGEAHEGKELLSQLERVTESVYGGELPQTVTADRGYASSANYEALEELGVAAVIPPQEDKTPHRVIPLRRFAYDAQHDVVRCPAGKYLTRKSRGLNGWTYRASRADCKACALRKRCFSASARTRSVLIKDGYCALLRARRCKEQGWPEHMQEAYQRHRWKVEGIHGEAKCQHGLRRAVRRGLSNIRIQAYLTAAVMNLKRLAAHAARRLNALFSRFLRPPLRRRRVFSLPWFIPKENLPAAA